MPTASWSCPTGPGGTKAGADDPFAAGLPPGSGSRSRSSSSVGENAKPAGDVLRPLLVALLPLGLAFARILGGFDARGDGAPDMNGSRGWRQRSGYSSASADDC